MVVSNRNLLFPEVYFQGIMLVLGKVTVLDTTKIVAKSYPPEV